jgi:hypothetical protein
MERFKKGDVVVCIDDSPPRFERRAPRLVLGDVYEVTQDGGIDSVRVTQMARCCSAHRMMIPTNNLMNYPWLAARFEKVGSIR